MPVAKKTPAKTTTKKESTVTTAKKTPAKKTTAAAKAPAPKKALTPEQLRSKRLTAWNGLDDAWQEYALSKVTETPAKAVKDFTEEIAGPGGIYDTHLNEILAAVQDRIAIVSTPRVQARTKPGAVAPKRTAGRPAAATVAKSTTAVDNAVAKKVAAKKTPATKKAEAKPVARRARRAVEEVVADAPVARPRAGARRR